MEPSLMLSRRTLLAASLGGGLIFLTSCAFNEPTVFADVANEELELRGRTVQLTFHRAAEARACVVLLSPRIYGEAIDDRALRDACAAAALSYLVIEDAGDDLRMSPRRDSTLPPTTTPDQEELASILTDVMAAVSSEQRVPVLLLGLGAAAEIAWMPYAQGDPNITAAVMINAPLPASTLFLGPRETSVLCLYGEQAQLAMSSFEPAHLGLQDAHILHEMLVFGEADGAMLNPDSDTYQAATASEIIETSVAWFTTYGGSSHDH